MTGQSQVDNQTLPNLLAAHIVQGVYYTTNITNATEDITAQSLAGQNITLSKNDTNFFGTYNYIHQNILLIPAISLVNNATIVVPNILLDSGVVHLIDTGMTLLKNINHFIQHMRIIYSVELHF